jgi:hypothetical protein
MTHMSKSHSQILSFLLLLGYKKTMPGSGQGSPGTVLIKTVTVNATSGSDSVIFEYGYNSNGKLTKYTSTLHDNTATNWNSVPIYILWLLKILAMMAAYYFLIDYLTREL